MAIVNWSNFTDFGDLPKLANEASGGSFWVGMFYMIWIIAILLMIGYGFEVAILVASFGALILGLVLVYADLMAFTWLLPIISLMLIMFLYIMWSSKKSTQE